MDPEPTPPAGTPAVPPVEAESSTIRTMRQQLDEANRKATDAQEAARKATEALTTKERAEMAELDRVKAELADRNKDLADLQPIRDEHGRFQSAFQTLYADELAAVPEAQRPMVERLSASGAWPDRLDALRTARALIPGAPAPITAGTNTRPGAAIPPTPGQQSPPVTAPLTPDQLRSTSWGAVLSKPTLTPGLNHSDD